MPLVLGDEHRNNLAWVGKLGEDEAIAMVSLAAKMLHEGTSSSTVIYDGLACRVMRSRSERSFFYCQ
jgi:hypothetical protein